jgi:hypothetical protein
MSTQYPLKKFTIKYDYDKKRFFMWNAEGDLVGEDDNGRELGRDAWNFGAQAVCYDYDLGLDERIPLTSLYAKYKTRNRMP